MNDPDEIINSLKRTTDKVDEMIIKEKEIKNKIIQYKENLNDEHNDLMFTMELNSKLVVDSRADEESNKEKEEILRIRLTTLQRNITTTKKSLKILRKPVTGIYNEWISHGLKEGVIERSFLQEEGLNKPSIHSKLGFLEAALKKLISFKKEKEQLDLGISQK